MHSTIATVFLAAAAGLTNAAAIVKRGNTSSSTQTECQGKGAYYVCANNNFRGYCSVDPCAKPWCPDFEAGTCLPPTENKSDKTVTVTETVTTTTCTESTTPTPQPPKPRCAASAQYYVCANNGFGGYCSTDPCAKAWCPDYKPHTYDCVDDASEETCTSPAVYSTTTVLSSLTYTTSTATPCSTITPTFTTVYTTPTPTTNTKPVTGTCAAGLGYYQVCSNGFTGCCKQDACAGAKPVCPGAEAQTTTYAA